MRSLCTASVTYSGLDVLLLAILVILVWTPLVLPLQESVGKDGGSERVVTLRRYGTAYGGFYYPENLDYLSERSIVYCVGAGEDISHDLELGHQLGGNVYIFDPTPRAITHAEYIKALLDGREAQRPSPNFGGGDRDYLDKIVSTQMEAKRVHFYDYGLFTEDKMMKFHFPSVKEHVSMSLLADYPGRGDDFTIVEVKKLSTIMRELGHDRIDLLKLDIEGCECEVLDQMLEEQIFPTYLGVDFDSLNTDREKSMRTINKLQKSGYVLMHQDGPDMSFMHVEGSSESVSPPSGSNINEEEDEVISKLYSLGRLGDGEGGLDAGTRTCAGDECIDHREQPKFFLHIPKTGSSFWLSMIEKHCPNMTSIHQIRHLYDELSVGNSYAYDCMSTFRAGHAPLDPSGAINQVVTLVRDPLKRIASGFANNFHDCFHMQSRIGVKEQGMHEEPGRRNSCSSDLLTHDNVLEYAKCVSACSTNMLQGKSCEDHPASRWHDGLEATLKGMAFVGITDRFKESTCAFKRRFKRVDGRPYLMLPDINTRESKNKTCASEVLSILRHNSFQAEDQHVYDFAKEWFNATLEPECVEHREELPRISLDEDEDLAATLARWREPVNETLVYNFHLIITEQMKSYDSPIYTEYVDKLLFKEFCRKLNVKTFAVKQIYNSLEEIDFSTFPETFILKSNTACGRNLIVRDGVIVRITRGVLNGLILREHLDEVKKIMATWNGTYLPGSMERQYDYTVPKIFEEEFIDPIPEDVKICVYKGEAHMLWLDYDRFTDHGRNFFDTQFRPIRFYKGYPPKQGARVGFSEDLKIRLLQTAERMARAVPLDSVRVDLFVVGGEIYAGEMTLSTDGGGVPMKLLPPEYPL